jgi:hypothetical protein
MKLNFKNKDLDTVLIREINQVLEELPESFFDDDVINDLESIAREIENNMQLMELLNILNNYKHNIILLFNLEEND